MPDRIQRQATITAQAIEARKNVQEQRIP
jgi:hypothetical protein